MSRLILAEVDNLPDWLRGVVREAAAERDPRPPITPDEAPFLSEAMRQDLEIHGWVRCPLTGQIIVRKQKETPR
ncbi:hypothetical protein ACQP2P_01440 [Dactylosporangium sp. CA-139114]|uniref:hypothetical protein n=1 Tax=Dactylosporangium sp. CA-139114 TaxID=3239931 RepID=UPI003D958B12